ncbi:hypothetical protein PENARI_c304G08218, partial [Penicillium arizonense]
MNDLESWTEYRFPFYWT